MIKLKCRNAEISCEEAEILTSGAVSAFDISFEFDSTWHELAKTAVFKNGSLSVSLLIPENGICKIPHEVLERQGMLYIGVYGTGGGITLPTVWCEVGNVNSGTEPAEASKEPTPGAYEQMLSLQMSTAKEAEGAKNAAESACEAVKDVRSSFKEHAAELKSMASDSVQRAEESFEAHASEIKKAANEAVQSILRRADDGEFDGNVMFASFAINPFSGLLEMTTPEGYKGPTFKITNGKMEVEING